MKSLYQINEENKLKYKTKDNTYNDFPLGTRAKVICVCADFNFFSPEKENLSGTVIENKMGEYRGITFKFDETSETFNFSPDELALIEGKQKSEEKWRKACREFTDYLSSKYTYWYKEAEHRNLHDTTDSWVHADDIKAIYETVSEKLEKIIEEHGLSLDTPNECNECDGSGIVYGEQDKLGKPTVGVCKKCGAEKP